MTQPLREDFPIYDLPSEKVIDGPWPPAPTPAAVLSNPDALSEDKPKKGRPKGSKSKPKKKRAKAKAPPVTPPVEPVPETKTPVMSLRVAAGGEGMLNRFRRVSPDVWWLIVAVATALALGSAIAYAVVR